MDLVGIDGGRAVARRSWMEQSGRQTQQSAQQMLQAKLAQLQQSGLDPAVCGWLRAQLQRQLETLQAQAQGAAGAAARLQPGPLTLPEFQRNQERDRLIDLLHPATRLVRPAWLSPVMGLISPSLPRLQPQLLQTVDGILLDAVLLLPDSGAAATTAPLLVMALGNGEHYEHRLPSLLQRSQELSLRILLYNGRGIGRSLGKEVSTHNQVTDCATAIVHACRLSARVAVEGFSLGGAVAAVALQRLQRGGELPVPIGLFINQHSFCDVPSWQACLEAAHGGASVARGRALWQARLLKHDFDPLDAAAALQQTRLARQVICTTVVGDRVVPAGAQLRDALPPRAGCWGSAPANSITWVSRRGTRHNDMSLAPKVRQALQRWRDDNPAAEQRGGIFRSPLRACVARFRHGGLL